MGEAVQDNKFVELTYKVTDKQTGQVLSTVEFPLGYVHGHNDILSAGVLDALEGKCAGDTIELAIDCTNIYGPRDEALVFTDRIENVPEQYRKLGTTIAMESEKGDVRRFVVTHMDAKTLTVDGNNPLSGREVNFCLEILSVRDATDEEIEAGGPTEAVPDIHDALKMPI